MVVLRLMECGFLAAHGGVWRWPDAHCSTDGRETALRHLPAWDSSEQRESWLSPPSYILLCVCVCVCLLYMCVRTCFTLCLLNGCNSMTLLPPRKPDGRCPSMLKRHAKYSQLFTWKRWPANNHITGKRNCVTWMEWNVCMCLNHVGYILGFLDHGNVREFLIVTVCLQFRLFLWLFAHWKYLCTQKPVWLHNSSKMKMQFCYHLLTLMLFQTQPGLCGKTVPVAAFLLNDVMMPLACSATLSKWNV